MGSQVSELLYVHTAVQVHGLYSIYVNSFIGKHAVFYVQSLKFKIKVFRAKKI